MLQMIRLVMPPMTSLVMLPLVCLTMRLPISLSKESTDVHPRSMLGANFVRLHPTTVVSYCRKVFRLKHEFYKKRYKWRSVDEGVVYNAWDHVARRRYRQWMSDMHKLWNKGKPKDDNIKEAEYDALQVYWLSDEFVSVSERNSQNRHGGNPWGPAPPTSGSRPLSSCALDFKLKLGRMPTHMEIYDALHRYLENLKSGYVRGDFINTKSFSLAVLFGDPGHIDIIGTE